MKINEGGVDRVIRVIVGLALLSMLLTDSPYKWFGLIGVPLVLTGGIGFCPGYALFGMNSCPTDKKQ